MSHIHPHAPPRRAGIGLKPAHFQAILDEPPAVGAFEIHAENYMVAGGPMHHFLECIRASWPLSLHGVGASLGGPDRPDPAHLTRLRALCERYQPTLFSEHLAWSSHGGAMLADLLPLPYDRAALDRLAAHIDEVQEALARPLALENPSRYLAFAADEMDEAAFLAALSRRTGCLLLLDVNNVHVSATNLGYDPGAYLDRFPMGRVAEIHLAGFAPDRDDKGRPLLIDAHDGKVDAAVWPLYAQAAAAAPDALTIVEWDNDVPDLSVLAAEAAVADSVRANGAPRSRAVA